MIAKRKPTNWDDVANQIEREAPKPAREPVAVAAAAIANAAPSAPSPAPHRLDCLSDCVSLDFPLGGSAPVVCDPFTGEEILTDDIDGVISLYEKLERIDKKVYAVKCEIRRAMAAKVAAQGEGKTKRIIGQLRAAKLEFPGDKWNQPTLKRLWEEWPQFAYTYLRISEIQPNLREVKKIENAAGDADFEAFRDELLAANLGPGDTLPTMKVEK